MEINNIKDKDIFIANKEKEIFDPSVQNSLCHDSIYILEAAIKELYPYSKIGKSFEGDNFYCEIYLYKGLTVNDFNSLEEKIAEIINRDDSVEYQVWKRDKALSFFREVDEFYRVRFLLELPENQNVMFYKRGNFLDLCMKKYLPLTRHFVKTIKLTNLVNLGYFEEKGNSYVLQKICGTLLLRNKQSQLHKQLNEELNEGNEKDHRKLGQVMSLFHLQHEAPGSVFWHPRGWTLYRTLKSYIRKCLESANYLEVNTPIMLSRDLWEASGHWEKFRSNMFTSCDQDLSGEKVLAIKPMSCPCHIQIFNQSVKSYHDLPLRLSEFGHCHRNEPSGSLYGLMRVRSMVQDDAHIFCTEDQIESEVRDFCALLKVVYKKLGFESVKVQLSSFSGTINDSELWNLAENRLREAIEKTGLECFGDQGEGAFYGPKLEFLLKDSIGRSWQCGTLQVDFILPRRLGATYIGKDGKKHNPVMLHRAILGSFERFIGILIEHFSGRLPIWLTPVQCVVATVTEEVKTYAQTIYADLIGSGIRTEIDLRNEKIGYKIRQHAVAKIPFMLILGKRELDLKTVAIRYLNEDRTEFLPLSEASSWFLSRVEI